MKKLSKAILLALAAVLAVAVLGLFCVNLYLQSPRPQEQIQAQLSRLLRMPLKIANTSVSPWSGVRITSVTIPSGDTNFLEAGSFTANYLKLPLLAGRLVIPEMIVDRPKVVWRQNSEGKWKLPSLEVAAAPGGEKPPEEAKKSSGGGFTVVVGRVVVKNGQVELVDNAGKHAAVFTNVTMTCTSLTTEKVEGTVDIGRAVWADSLAVENVHAPFKYAAGEFTLPEIAGTLGGGPAHGSYRGQPDAPRSPFEATLTFEKANLDQLATEMGWKAGEAVGTLSGRLGAKGDLDRAERVEGPGRLELRDAQFQNLELFQSIGEALGVNLRFRDGNADFHLGGGKVNIDQLVLSAADSRLDAKGYIRFDKKVSLDTRLVLDERSVKRLPDLIRSSFATADDGTRTIDFAISGTTDKIRTNLIDKLIGQKINQQAGDLFSRIFGGGKKEDDKRKKEEDDRQKEEKKRKREQEKAEAAKASAAPNPAPGAPTTAITPTNP